MVTDKISDRNLTTNTVLLSQKTREWEEPWNKLVIDLEAIKSNYKYLRTRIPKDTVFYAVVKSDAYGHGLDKVCIALIEAGCKHFAVYSPQEGIQIRKLGFTGEILLLNPIPKWMTEMAVFHDLSVSVFHPSILKPLNNIANELNKRCKIHLKINVGLNRMGISPSKLKKIARMASSMNHLDMEGLYAQPRDHKSVKECFDKINQIYGDLKVEGIAPKFMHFANSTTFLAYPNTVAGGVRIGILLYGVLPPEQDSNNIDAPQLKPVMSLSSCVVQLRKLSEGSLVGYRAKYKVNRDSLIATIPLGYADGLNRNLAKNGSVSINGKKSPFFGAISMNSSTIDVTNIPNVSIGDEVMIIGHQGHSRIRINQIARDSETISGELMVRLGSSIARYYMSSNNNIDTVRVFSNNKAKVFNIQYIETEKDMPKWLKMYDLVEFIRRQSKPFEDSIETIRAVINYALSTDVDGKGFVLIASNNHRLEGSIVSIKNDTRDFMPQNIVVYCCVRRESRRQGLGSSLMRKIINLTNGDLVAHLDKKNSAINFYRDIGFKDNYLEMRYSKENIVNVK